MKYLLLSLFLIVSCSKTKLTEKTILYVDSYHASYEWSSELTRGIKETLKNEKIKLVIERMDSKRNSSEKYKKDISLKIKKRIDELSPDLIISSDDNAMKYLIMPYYKNAKTPVVFAGVNWGGQIYNLPYSNTTGMVEVTMIKSLVEHLQRFTKGARIGYLANDNLTARKEEAYARKLFKISYNSRYVKTFQDWKRAFLLLQNENDMIIIGNIAGLSDWDEEEARKHITKNSRKPSGAFYMWLAPFAAITISHSAYEQGEWASKTALDILNGKSPSEIPITTNKRAQITINIKIAEKLGMELTPPILKISDIYEEKDID